VGTAAKIVLAKSRLDCIARRSLSPRAPWR
jgi:hypothetical protein